VVLRLSPTIFLGLLKLLIGLLFGETLVDLLKRFPAAFLGVMVRRKTTRAMADWHSTEPAADQVHAGHAQPDVGDGRFGARSGASVIFLGLLKLLIGLLFGETLVDLLKRFPAKTTRAMADWHSTEPAADQVHAGHAQPDVGDGWSAAQYRFGARSGASVIFLGLLKLLIGLLFGETLVDQVSTGRGISHLLLSELRTDTAPQDHQSHGRLA
jgi:hypothetical protein